MPESVRIAWDEGRTVSGRLVRSSGSGPVVLLAHGAGASQDHPLMVGLRDGLAAGGVTVFTFNYPYMEEGRKRPDRQEVLSASHRAATSWLRDEVSSEIVLGGRSMGGRIGTLLAADGEPCAGLILYSYPLHPIGKPDRLRKDHLSSIRAPMLFITGTRDPMAKSELVEEWLRPLPNTTVELVPDGDHSYRVRKSSGRTQEEALAWIVRRSVEWLENL